MALICVVSPKGGVGKTTCVASLAYGLRGLGYRVVVADFDSQNALRLHFGMDLEDGRGFVRGSLASEDWQSMAVVTDAGIKLLPYGFVERPERQAFERALAQPAFLERGLASLSNAPGTIVIADLPPGDSSALEAVSRLADLRLTVLLADSASVSLLPRVEEGHFYPDSVPAHSRHGYILNQVDPRRRLNNEITDFMAQRHGDSLFGLIHRDEALAEANARQMSVFDYAPNARATEDLKACVQRVVHELGEIEGTAVESPRGYS